MAALGAWYGIGRAAHRLAVALTAWLGGVCGESASAPLDVPSGGGTGLPPDFQRIQHVVVIYLENRSFDNLFGQFPGADGIAQAGDHAIQKDRDGVPYKVLRPPSDNRLGAAFPANLPNAPFEIENFVPQDQPIPDPTHEFYIQQIQIDSGRMDLFAAYSGAAGLVMGTYRTANLPLYPEARGYVLCDEFFHAAFGGSFLNHQWLIAAATPPFPNAPAAMRATLDSTGQLVHNGRVTPDGYAVGTVLGALHPATTPPDELLPPLTYPNIGDRLSDAGLSWAWYAGGWKNPQTGQHDPLLVYHHQPFTYFERYAPGTPGADAHLKDESEFLAAARDGALPAVAFVKPLAPLNEHPGYSTVTAAERHAVDLIDAVRKGPAWSSSVIIVVYDENGGFWDHVAPPVIDRWGPGTRVPAIIVSPFARKGLVDHTRYDTTSILAFIERRWNLEPLGTRDAAAADFRNAFDFTGAP